MRKYVIAVFLVVLLVAGLRADGWPADAVDYRVVDSDGTETFAHDLDGTVARVRDRLAAGAGWVRIDRIRRRPALDGDVHAAVVHGILGERRGTNRFALDRGEGYPQQLLDVSVAIVTDFGGQTISPSTLRSGDVVAVWRQGETASLVVVMGREP